jgi:hypothetical protein
LHVNCTFHPIPLYPIPFNFPPPPHIQYYRCFFSSPSLLFLAGFFLLAIESLDSSYV